MLYGKSFPRTYCKANGTIEPKSKLDLLDYTYRHTNFARQRSSFSTRIYIFTQYHLRLEFFQNILCASSAGTDELKLGNGGGKTGKPVSETPQTACTLVYVTH